MLQLEQHSGECSASVQSIRPTMPYTLHRISHSHRSRPLLAGFVGGVTPPSSAKLTIAGPLALNISWTPPINGPPGSGYGIVVQDSAQSLVVFSHVSPRHASPSAPYPHNLQWVHGIGFTNTLIHPA